MDGKRLPASQPGPPPKRGPGPPLDDFDDLIEEDFLEDDVPSLPEPHDLDEGLDVDLSHAGRNWLRPPAAAINPATDPLCAWPLLGRCAAGVEGD